MTNTIQDYLRHIARRSVRVQDRMNKYIHHEKNELSDGELKKIRIKHIGDYQGYKFYYVNGEYIRDNVDIDFCLGGSYSRYKYIPENDFWLEHTAEKGDIAPTILHEYIECGKMVKDEWIYDKAHDFASKYEKAFRKVYKPSKDIFQDFIKEYERIHGSKLEGTSC